MRRGRGQRRGQLKGGMLLLSPAAIQGERDVDKEDKEKCLEGCLS